MPVKINGLTNGSATIKAADSGTDITLTLPSSTANIAAEPSAWISYTPTWTNLTIGNGINEFAYSRIGSIVFVRGNFVFGSTTSVSNVFFPSIPLPYASGAFALGAAWGFDSSTTTWNNMTFAPLNYFISSSGARVNATVPWTWATSDIIRFSITYETG